MKPSRGLRRHRDTGSRPLGQWVCRVPRPCRRSYRSTGDHGLPEFTFMVMGVCPRVLNVTKRGRFHIRVTAPASRPSLTVATAARFGECGAGDTVNRYVTVLLRQAEPLWAVALMAIPRWKGRSGGQPNDRQLLPRPRKPMPQGSP